MSDDFPAGALVKVTMVIRLPHAATEDQVDEWLRYSCGHQGGCSMKNPLLNGEAEPWGGYGSFEWEDTGYVGEREEFDHWSKPDGTRGCTVRHSRTRRAA